MPAMIVTDAKTLIQNNPALTQRMLRYWLVQNLDDFRSRCAIKVGRRVLLDQGEVEAWLSAHRQGAERPVEILT